MNHLPSSLKVTITTLIYSIIAAILWAVINFFGENLTNIDSLNSFLSTVFQITLLFYFSFSILFLISFLGYIKFQDKAIKFTSLAVSIMSASSIVMLYAISL